MRKAFASLLFVLLASAGLRAQEADSGARLALHVEGALFFQNNEYEHELIDGYTLPGFFLRPYLRWQSERRVSIEAGVHWLYYWGAHHYPAAYTYEGLPDWNDTTRALHLVPWMRARVELGRGIDLVIGSLDRHDGHRLPFPLYNPEHLYTSDPEAGIQLRVEKPWLQSDVWVDWREMIFRRSPRKEQFTFGLNAEPRLRIGHGWSVSASALLIAQHKGGNFVADTVKPINLLNYGGSLGVRFQPSDSLRFDLRALLVAYHQHHDPLPPFEDGRGLFVSLGAKGRCFDAEVGWWRGYQFIPLCGNYHFSNLSSTTPDLHFDTRDMLTLRADYRYRKLRSTTLVVGLQWYHYFPYTGDRDHPDYPAKVICTSANGFGIGVQLWFNPSFTLLP